MKSKFINMDLQLYRMAEGKVIKSFVDSGLIGRDFLLLNFNFYHNEYLVCFRWNR